MPAGDGTGPTGQGPMTGRGMGSCNCMPLCGCGYGRRFGRPRGLARFFGYKGPQTEEEYKKSLEDFRDSLKEELEEVEKELNK
jgi:uncharacterized protein DUF5320